MSKVLVVALGQMRGSSITLGNFKRYLISELDADLAICTTSDDNFDIANPFYQAAKYRWISPHYDDFADAFDKAAQVAGSESNWRSSLRAKGNWCGGIKESGRSGMGSVPIFLRWFLWKNIEAIGLNDYYEHLIVTRTDFMFLSPHPTVEQLGRDKICIPNGEDYTGLNDRHIVIPMEKAESVLDIFTNINTNPDAFADILSKSEHCNIEAVIKVQLFMQKILGDVTRFPYIMYLARSDNDPTSFSQDILHHELGHYVKYQTEYVYATFFAELIKSSEDWNRYFDFVNRYKWGNESWLKVLEHDDLFAYSTINKDLALLISDLMKASIIDGASPQGGKPVNASSLLLGLAHRLAMPGTPRFFGYDTFEEFVLT